MLSSLSLLVGQVVAEPNILEAPLAQLTAFAAAIGTVCFGIAAVVRALVDAYVKIKESRPPRIEPDKVNA